MPAHDFRVTTQCWSSCSSDHRDLPYYVSLRLEWCPQAGLTGPVISGLLSNPINRGPKLSGSIYILPVLGLSSPQANPDPLNTQIRLGGTPQVPACAPVFADTECKPERMKTPRHPVLHRGYTEVWANGELIVLCY